MRYKVGDKVRVRGDLEIGKSYGNITFISSMEKNKTFKILFDRESEHYDLDDEYNLCYSSEMLRPAEFKIWCETEKEKQAVLEELEKEGYKLASMQEEKKDFRNTIPVYFVIGENGFCCGTLKIPFRMLNISELTPSEFTGIDFSEKIIISKTLTGVTATYGDKTVTTEGEFDDASRQALAEVLCPFKVGDCLRVKKEHMLFGEVTKISINGKVKIKAEGYEDWRYPIELEPYAEPYNAKLFCVKNCGRFEAGHVYEVKNGVFTDGNPNHTMTVSNIDELNGRFGECDECYFMEIKGGLDE